MFRALLLAAAPLLCAAAQFEVATIRPVATGGPVLVGIRVCPGGRVVLSGLPLKGLIAAAFHLAYWQISGSEPWMESPAMSCGSASKTRRVPGAE